MDSAPVLSVENLKAHFRTDQGDVQAVRGVSFQVFPGEVLGIVGESGSGKSAVMYSVTGLLASNGVVTGGAVQFGGTDICRLAFRDEKSYEAHMRRIRGKELSMIFQDPMTFLNPVLTVGKQLCEPIRNHARVPAREAMRRAEQLLRQAGISSPQTRLHQYPHEFSGGMRQRIIIAIALANSPRLVIADEPTTALDVTVQAQILDLIRTMTRDSGSSTILITHDLGVVASLCDRVCIMYAGKIVETGTDTEIFNQPAHPYTRGLLSCVSNPAEPDRDLEPIPGTPPDLLSPSAGCAFADRCPQAMRVCSRLQPPEEGISPTHTWSCWLAEAARRRGGAQ